MSEQREGETCRPTCGNTARVCYQEGSEMWDGAPPGSREAARLLP